VDTSAIVPIVPSVTLPAAAVVILSGEMVIEIPIPCHRSAALVGIVHLLCHGEIGGFHQSFVCHVLIIGAVSEGDDTLCDSLPTVLGSGLLPSSMLGCHACESCRCTPASVS
jgi:hypothetical protein